MNQNLKKIFFFLLLLSAQIAFAEKGDTDLGTTAKEKDMVDVFKKIGHANDSLSLSKKNENKPHFAFAPALGYTLQTGFAGLLSANLVYSNSDAKQSEILTNVAYTQYNQIIFPFHAEIWTKKNRFKIVSDNRFMKYPSMTFGLGNPRRFAPEQNGYYIDFQYLKFHESALLKITKNWYAGMGYFVDYFWNEREINPPFGQPTSLEKYYNSAIPQKEIASGLNFQTLFDTRDNPVNPHKGFFSSINYRNNLEWLGSDQHWQSAIFEFKKYFTFPAKSKNVLAIWNYDWFTTGGRTPYLLLPSTGWDDFFNTGRGYIQGRYRGKNMTYWEMEYRFRILRNGLLGGVVFGNAQRFSRDIIQTPRDATEFGYGLGLRIKLNKHSDTNLCVDYGWGQNGSQGFFVNLGEVF